MADNKPLTKPTLTARYVEAQPESGPYKPAMPAHWVIEDGLTIVARPIDLHVLDAAASDRTEQYVTATDLDRFEAIATPAYRSTAEAGRLSRFVVSDLGQYVVRLAAEVRRLRAMLGECVRLYPEVGHEDEGYACTTHNMPWGECPEPGDSQPGGRP